MDRCNHDLRRSFVTMRAKAKIIFDTRHHGATKPKMSNVHIEIFCYRKNKANHLLFV